jgi:hypothetical protein
MNNFSLFLWLVADANLLREKYCWLIAGLFREKSTTVWWLISQTNEQGVYVTTRLHSTT